MQDKQNKGIGQYKDRPGYFLGGMIGGAILGALVNKVQGKDVARGAMWGGITGGLGSAFMGPSSSSWISKMNPGIMKSMATMGAGNPALAGTILGGGASWLAGDPKKDREDFLEWKEDQRREQMARNKSFYDRWYVNPWTGQEMGHNSGGIVNARPGYWNGGGAWSGVASDEEVLGSEQDKILSITGQSGLEGQQGLEDILETLEMSSGPGQGDMSGWHEMYLDLKGKGELPDWMDSFEIFMQNLDTLDISPTDFSAKGGYKKKAAGGLEDLDMTGGGASFGPGTGTSDDIPAMLSDGEFVVTAKAVENLGGGDRMVGARKMYQMMNQLDPASQTPAEMSAVGRA